MELKYIKEIVCPKCGCDIIENEHIEIDRYSRKSKYREHYNGGRWEHRTFACGQKLSYCPNGNNIETSEFSICKKSNEFLLRQHKREVFKDLVITFIESNGDVDEKFRNAIKNSLPSV